MTEAVLHAYAAPKLAIAFAYLLAFIVTKRTLSYAPRHVEGDVKEACLGFALGALGYAMVTIIDAYIVKTPLLSLMLLEKGAEAREIAHAIAYYSFIFSVAYVSIVFISTFLLAHAIYSLVIKSR